MTSPNKTENHWDAHTLGFLESYLADASALVRIATGYFSIPGYDALRTAVGRTRLHVLIGFDEGAHDTVTANLVETILAELRAWRHDRYAAIRRLAEALGPRLRITHTRLRQQDHAKVYIVDERAAMIGSANVSRGGLFQNHEAMTVVTHKSSLAFWVDEFDRRWNDEATVDITDDLRQRLLDWLRLRTPWEVFVRAAYLLLDAAPPRNPSSLYRRPAEYQQVVVNRVVRQLLDDERRGSFLIASTGLGKTIMATAAALELSTAEEVNHVLVFCPAHVTDEWRRRLGAARLSHDTFTIDLLSREDSSGVQSMCEALDNADRYTLIVIDESHRLRNRFAIHRGRKTPIVRTSVKRIEDAVRDSGCRVLLLTGTPLASDLDDIKNQLHLLPHTSTEPHGNGMLNLFAQYPWSLSSIEHLVGLPVATIINTPFVAKHFARHDPVQNADYVDYPDGGRRFIPHLTLQRAPTPLPIQEVMVELLDRRVLRHAPVSIPVGHTYRKVDNVAEREATTAWASSPRALLRTFRDVIADEYKLPFLLPLDRLAELLQPAISTLEKLTYREDLKFHALRAVLKLALDAGQKAIVFTERRETALYLEEGLRQEGLKRVASVVKEDAGGPALKPQSAIDRIIRHFAPRSNTEVNGKAPADQYDVLITTDTLSEGVNLQDANYLVSYDLAWTADVIVQRAGRVLRLGEEPRHVNLFAFVPERSVQVRHDAVSRMPEARVKRLAERLRATEHYTELPLLPEDAHELERLGGLSKIPLFENANFDPTVALDPAFAETSTALIDYTLLHTHREEAISLGDDLLTARVDRRVKSPTMFTVVRHLGRHQLLRYAAGDERAAVITEDVLLDYLRCKPNTPTALVNPADVERLRYQALEFWRKQRGVGDDEVVEHICSALLVGEESVERVFS